MTTDPIADFLTRVRNALAARHPSVDVPSSNMKASLARILEQRGYISGYEIIADGAQPTLRMKLKYVDGKPAIRSLVRISRPGIRQYRGAKELPRVKNGYGVGLVSTPKGVLTDQDARKQNVGGEVLCYIW